MIRTYDLNDFGGGFTKEFFKRLMTDQMELKPSSTELKVAYAVDPRFDSLARSATIVGFVGQDNSELQIPGAMTVNWFGKVVTLIPTLSSNGPSIVSVSFGDDE